MTNQPSTIGPKARVNIQLTLKDQDGEVKKELPLKLLLLGNYSASQSQSPFSQRTRISINQNNFNHVLNEMAPRLQLDVINHLENKAPRLHCDLTLRHIDDFSPKAIVNQVPPLKKLLLMRHLIKDLKANILDKQQFRQALMEILKDKKQVAQLKNEINALAIVQTGGQDE